MMKPWDDVFERRCLFQGDVLDAGWSSPVARQAHNLKVTGSNPVPATKVITALGTSVPGAVFVWSVDLPVDASQGDETENGD